MPRIDADGVEHPVGSDIVTVAGLAHIDRCGFCSQLRDDRQWVIDQVVSPKLKHDEVAVSSNFYVWGLTSWYLLLIGCIVMGVYLAFGY